MTVLYFLKKNPKDWFPCDCNITTCIHHFLQVLFLQKKKFYLKEIMCTCSNVMSVHL